MDGDRDDYAAEGDALPAFLVGEAEPDDEEPADVPFWVAAE